MKLKPIDVVVLVRFQRERGANRASPRVVVSTRSVVFPSPSAYVLSAVSIAAAAAIASIVFSRALSSRTRGRALVARVVTVADVVSARMPAVAHLRLAPASRDARAIASSRARRRTLFFASHAVPRARVGVDERIVRRRLSVVANRRDESFHSSHRRARDGARRFLASNVRPARGKIFPIVPSSRPCVARVARARCRRGWCRCRHRETRRR